ncbi:MAG: DUF5814 domain-containing protein [Candidatus Hodarchaeales archaeon]
MSDLMPIRVYRMMYLRPEHVTDKIVFRYFCIAKSIMINRLADLEGKMVFDWKDSKEKKFLRVTRFSWRVHGKYFPENPDKAVVLFKKIRIVVIDENTNKKMIDGIKEFFQAFQIRATAKIGKTCPSCYSRDRITLLVSKRQYIDDISAKEKILCRNCIVNELERELQLLGIKPSKELSAHGIKILDTTRKLSQAIKFYQEGQDLGLGTLLKQTEAKSLSKDIKIPEEVNKAPIHPSIKESLLKNGIVKFMPVQRLSLSKGLLEGKSQLVMADTSAGKTLIGEMAGLNKLLEKKKMLFCVPLVALANTKFDDFKKKYPEYKIGLKTGKPRIRLGNKKARHSNRGFEDADIIIGTYEGIDQYLRSGGRFRDTGCVVIDEIQSLSDPDRGPYLDGLISRLKISSKAQIICLSATIGNPEDLASKIGVNLVIYKGRPVPLEQHMIVVRNDEQKQEQIVKLVKSQRKTRSKHGFKGQTIIFTNSRKKANDIAAFVRSKGVNCSTYHAGLSYSRRRAIEQKFSRGKLPAVTATYALGAGVDFPASMVIFESIMMGNKLLSTNYYRQMTGRAGRLGMHDKGIAVLLAKPEPPYGALTLSEIDLGMKIVNSPLDDVNPSYTDLDCSNQILATICFYKKCTVSRLVAVFSSLIGARSSLKVLVKDLLNKNLIMFEKRDEPSSSKILIPTPLGKAGSVSFLSVDEIMLIKKRLLQKSFSVVNLVIELEPFESIYIKPAVKASFEGKMRIKSSSRFLNSSILDLLSDSGGKIDEKLDSKMSEILKRWKETFFSSCNCEENPYCEHGLIMICRRIIQLRRKGHDPEGIGKFFENKYALQIYSGDLLKWLELVVFRLEGIIRIGNIVYPAAVEKIEELKNSIIRS